MTFSRVAEVTQLVVITAITAAMASFASTETLARSRVRDLCTQVRTVSVVSTLDELQNSVCEIRERNAIDPGIQALTGQIFESIRAIQRENSDANWQDDDSLGSKLSQLGEAMNRSSSSRPSSPPTSELGKAIQELERKWGDPTAREAGRDNYLADLKQVLARTRTGKVVMDCFAADQGPLISGDVVLPLNEKLRQQGAAMALLVEPDPKLTGKFQRVLVFDEQAPPTRALEYLAHELKHGCNAGVRARIHSLPATDAVIRLQAQEITVDEMRAYQVGTELFKELAEASPATACQSYGLSEIFGRQVISAAEYHAKIDEMYEDGRFPQYLVSRYVASGIYPREACLDSHGRLLPHIHRAIESNGFRVAPAQKP